jgi:hypothetical protein
MSQPLFQEGSEPMWWWKVAMHLDEAHLASVNAMAHNLQNQMPVFALQDKIQEAQTILLEIFRWKGLLPGSTNVPIAPVQVVDEAPSTEAPAVAAEEPAAVPMAQIAVDVSAPDAVDVSPPDGELPEA